MAGENWPYLTFQKAYFTMFVVATEFPKQTLGIDDFLFPRIAVPTPYHGNNMPEFHSHVITRE